MFTALRNAVAGYKTYAVAALTSLIPLVAYFCGPVDITVGTAVVHIPQVDFPTLWHSIQISGTAATIRAAIGRILAAKSAAAATSLPTGQ